MKTIQVNLGAVQLWNHKYLVTRQFKTKEKKKTQPLRTHFHRKSFLWLSFSKLIHTDIIHIANPQRDS